MEKTSTKIVPWSYLNNLVFLDTIILFDCWINTNHIQPLFMYYLLAVIACLSLWLNIFVCVNTLCIYLYVCMYYYLYIYLYQRVYRTTLYPLFSRVPPIYCRCKPHVFYLNPIDCNTIVTHCSQLSLVHLCSNWLFYLRYTTTICNNDCLSFVMHYWCFEGTHWSKEKVSNKLKMDFLILKDGFDHVDCNMHKKDGG